MLEAIFSEIIEGNKKAFIFQQGNCTMNVLHPSLSKSFVLSIYNRNPMKNSTLGYFCKSTYSQMHRKLQPWWHFRRWLLYYVLQVEISHLTLCQMFWLPKPSNIYGESDFVSSTLRNKLEKYTFSWIKKETFISNGRKILVNSSKKYIKFVSSGYHFPSYISALIKLFCLAFQGLSCWEASVTLYLWFQF